MEQREWENLIVELCARAFAAVIFIFIVVSIFILTGCASTRYVTVPEYHERLVHTYDTVHQRDSFISNTHTTIREVDSAQMAQFGIRIAGMQRAFLVETATLRQQISNLSKSRSDTVIVRDTIPKVVEVPARLTTWESMKIRFGEIVLLILAVVIVAVVMQHLRKR